MVDPISSLLHDFIIDNREQIIDRARRRGRERSGGKSTDLEDGIPLFLTQLSDELLPTLPTNVLQLVGARGASKITDSAALRGHELLRSGFAFAQVVHGYGDVCQVVVELASEQQAPLGAEDFHVLDRCVDEAIAGAVTAYGLERERDVAREGTERLGALAREMRSLLNTAILSFDVMKAGIVGVGGSTGTQHSRSLSNLRALIERSLTEVRLDAGVLVMERFSVPEFMLEIEVGAAAQARGLGLQLTADCCDRDVVVRADWEILALAVSNLLENAFKFTPARGHVSLTARATPERVLINVGDQCRGFPSGKAEELSRYFRRGCAERPSLGLGLSTALRAIRANSGDLVVRDIPGKGCVFTVELPRQPSSTV